ncbi:MAG: argininosuccinate lyase [Candidatus Korobacteraceae bacterium]|jgi:argininosuccinate lyase
MRERVKAPPSKVIIDYIMRPRLEADSRDSFEPLMDLNRAHVVMLAARGIVPRAAASQLMRVFEDVCQAGTAAITWDPALEEVYYNLETHIIKKAGPAIGGQMHTGRSRNDLIAALTRMFTRSQLLNFSVFLHELRRVLLEKAESHAHTIVTGYTHMQPAQPTTLGHYFHAIDNALERDELRLRQAYQAANRCPLGACAFNATGFPIDRQMLAELTGFDGLAENSIDAIASRDYVSQVLAALAILAVNLSRLAQDLYIWGTDEFGWIEVGDDVAATSSIMPQKKNPISLEHIRGKAAHLIGTLVATLTAQKGTPYGHQRDVSFESTHPLREGFGEAEAIVNLATATLRSLQVKATVAEARAESNFSTVTELADVIVREKGLSFREAHGVVGAAVSELYDRGGRTPDLSLALLDQVALERLGRPLGLSEASLRRALSPAENVAVRSVTGGPAPKEVLRSVRVSMERFAADQAWWREQKEKLEVARHRLDSAAAELTGAQATIKP